MSGSALATTRCDDNEWHHIVGTYSEGGGADNVNIYIDGDLETTSTSTGIINSNTEPFHIGRDTYSGGSFFDGSIDEVKIYNRALSEPEILKNYKHGKSKHS